MNQLIKIYFVGLSFEMWLFDQLIFDPFSINHFLHVQFAMGHNQYVQSFNISVSTLKETIMSVFIGTG